MIRQDINVGMVVAGQVWEVLEGGLAKTYPLQGFYRWVAEAVPQINGCFLAIFPVH
jgi:hypothetical protein